MKEQYNAPSVTVYPAVAREDLANSFSFDSLLGRNAGQDDNTSVASSDIHIPFRDYKV